MINTKFLLGSALAAMASIAARGDGRQCRTRGTARVLLREVLRRLEGRNQ